MLISLLSRPLTSICFGAEGGTRSSWKCFPVGVVEALLGCIFLFFQQNVFMLTNHAAPVVIGGGLEASKFFFMFSFVNLSGSLTHFCRVFECRLSLSMQTDQTDPELF